MNGIDLLLADHRTVAALFDQFESTGDGTLVGEIAGHLTAHDEAEHAALYPLVGKVLGDAKLIERAAAAHAAVKAQLDRMRFLEGAPLVAAVAELRALVEAHVADEEKAIFPKLARAADPTQLDWLAHHIEQTKQRVG